MHLCLSLASPQRLKTGVTIPTPSPRATGAHPHRRLSSTQGAHVRSKPSRSSTDGTSRSRTRGPNPKTTHGTLRRHQQRRGVATDRITSPLTTCLSLSPGTINHRSLRSTSLGSSQIRTLTARIPGASHSSNNPGANHRPIPG